MNLGVSRNIARNAVCDAYQDLFDRIIRDNALEELLVTDDLADMRQLFRERRKLNLHSLAHSWRETTDDWLAKNGYV